MLKSLSRKARQRYRAAKNEAFEAGWVGRKAARVLKRAAKTYGKAALRYDARRAIAEGLEELDTTLPLF